MPGFLRKLLVGGLIIVAFGAPLAIAQQQGPPPQRPSPPNPDRPSEARATRATQVENWSFAGNPSRDPANWRLLDPARTVYFDTVYGRMIIEVMPELAPNHVARFLELTREGLYDTSPFHRVIEGFVAQGGDISRVFGEDARKAPIAAEFTADRTQLGKIDTIGDPDLATAGFLNGMPLRMQPETARAMFVEASLRAWAPHCAGIVSGARTNDPNSFSDQFFLMRGRVENLDKNYTPFGRIVVGAHIPYRISLGDPPQIPDRLQRAYVAATAPAEEKVETWVMRTDGPMFRARMEQEGASFDPCEITVPAVVVDALPSPPPAWVTDWREAGLYDQLVAQTQ